MNLDKVPRFRLDLQGSVHCLFPFYTIETQPSQGSFKSASSGY